MPANVSTFKSAKSIATIDKIIAVLKERGGASVWDLTLATGLTQQHISLYLRHLAKIGLVVCTEPAVFRPGGSVGAHWELAPDAEQLEAELASRDEFQRQVIVRKEWEPNHARMKLDCYLFGVPAILEEEAA